MSDSIECNASTFAMEMKETAYILNSLGASSLVIIDELGRGTSPEEGAALCWAISEALAKTSSFTFLATHFRLLTKMESISIGIVNSCFVTELREGVLGHQDSRLLTHRNQAGLVIELPDPILLEVQCFNLRRQAILFLHFKAVQ